VRLDGAHAERTVGTGARQNDANRATLVRCGQRFEKEVDRHQAVSAHGLGRFELAVRDAQQRSRRDHVHVVGLDRHGIRDSAHRQACRLLQKMGQVRLVLRRQVDDDDVRDASVERSVLEELGQRYKPARGSAEADDHDVVRSLAGLRREWRFVH